MRFQAVEHNAYQSPKLAYVQVDVSAALDRAGNLRTSFEQGYDRGLKTVLQTFYGRPAKSRLTH